MWSIVNSKVKKIKSAIIIGHNNYVMCIVIRLLNADFKSNIEYKE